MADVDIISQLAGPVGALVATATGAAVLWRRHVVADDALLKISTDTIAHERERTREAEERLDALGATMRAATDVMERSVGLTEKVLERERRFRVGDRDG